MNKVSTRYSQCYQQNTEQTFTKSIDYSYDMSYYLIRDFERVFASRMEGRTYEQ